MTRDPKDIFIVLTIMLLSLLAGILYGITMSRREIAKAKQPKIIQVDTSNAHVIYEDTWGKVLLIKNEDL